MTKETQKARWLAAACRWNEVNVILQRAMAERYSDDPVLIKIKADLEAAEQQLYQAVSPAETAWNDANDMWSAAIIANQQAAREWARAEEDWLKAQKAWYLAQA